MFDSGGSKRAPILAPFDVLIAGAGPAGASAAIALAQVAPDLRICLVDAPSDPRPRLGEILSPVIAPILEQLGLWSAFTAQGYSPSHRAYSAWGEDVLTPNEFILQARGPAWRVDRNGFDTWLAREARDRVQVTVSGKVVSLRREAEGWVVDCGEAGIFTAAFVIDATGRPAVLARRLGLTHIGDDRLTAHALHLDGAPGVCGDFDELVVEAARDGWWYTAALPDGRRVVVCLTDPDIAKARGLREAEGWRRALDETRHIAAIVGAPPTAQATLVWPAGARRLAAPAMHDLLCVGDAAACFDPISAVGVPKALRSGLFAAYAVADRFLRADPAGVQRFWAVAESEHQGYARGLALYYGLERRWPDSPFWARRQAREPAVAATAPA